MILFLCSCFQLMISECAIDHCSDCSKNLATNAVVCIQCEEGYSFDAMGNCAEGKDLVI